MSYAELQVTTHFSFLRGASSAQELFYVLTNLPTILNTCCDDDDA